MNGWYYYPVTLSAYSVDTRICTCPGLAILFYCKAMENAERYVVRWQQAGFIDESTAAAIRAYEAQQTKPRGRQWQVLLALIAGGILLAAGVLLFVAAHWETVSPGGRLLLVLSMLVFFHGLGIVVCTRFPALATAMHAIGTVSAGAVIALIGQIFNIQEHWPSAVLLWALCAAAGWLLLRDQFQQTFALLLLPAWIVCEWGDRASAYSGERVYIARLLAVIGVVYLTAFLRTRKQIVFGILFGVGALLLAISTGILSSGWESSYYYGHDWGFVPLSYRLVAIGVILLTAIVGLVVEKRSILPCAITVVVIWALPWAQKTVTYGTGIRMWKTNQPNLLAYVMVAAAALAFVAWGVRISAKSLVNYGMAAFGITVIWFYFSSVMDKLGRSVGLMMLGVLFLVGGWLLERTRRKLVGSIAGGAA